VTWSQKAFSQSSTVSELPSIAVVSAAFMYGGHRRQLKLLM
jgi:hypothetical protein